LRIGQFAYEAEEVYYSSIMFIKKKKKEKKKSEAQSEICENICVCMHHGFGSRGYTVSIINLSLNNDKRYIYIHLSFVYFGIFK